MTEFGVDIHPSFQAGLSVATLPGQGISFLLVKVTEGTGWYRAGYHDFAATAKRAGLLFSAYHFLRSESPGEAQAAWTQQCMGDDWGVVPVMLDWETSVAGTRAGLATANAYITETRRHGGKIALNYLPRWYWSAIGSPDLAAAGPVSTLALIQSAYGQNPAGSPASIYPGDKSARWAGFGGLPVSILQFGSNARLAGYSGPLDINAYRDSRGELAATGWFHDPNPQEDDVNLNDSMAPYVKFEAKVGDVLASAYQYAKGANEKSSKALASLGELVAALGAEQARDVEQNAELARIHEEILKVQAGDPETIARRIFELVSPELHDELVSALQRLRLSIADAPPE